MRRRETVHVMRVCLLRVQRRACGRGGRVGVWACGVVGVWVRCAWCACRAWSAAMLVSCRDSREPSCWTEPGPVGPVLTRAMGIGHARQTPLAQNPPLGFTPTTPSTRSLPWPRPYESMTSFSICRDNFFLVHHLIGSEQSDLAVGTPPSGRASWTSTLSWQSVLEKSGCA